MTTYITISCLHRLYYVHSVIQMCYTTLYTEGMFFIIDVPQNGSVSESLTHTSGHILFKTTPLGLGYQHRLSLPAASTLLHADK